MLTISIHFCQNINTRTTGRRQLRYNELIEDAWHGSPYNFGNFSTSNIGKGVGNLQYGWGLYFTSEKQIAEYYRDNVYDDGFVMQTNARIRELDTNARQAKAQGNIEQAENLAAQRDELINSKHNKTRYVYRVRIPDHHEYMDWDNLLTQQSKYIQAALSNAPEVVNMDWDDDNGASVYNYLADRFKTQKAASEYLSGLGIAGIRYESSTPTNHYNYVVFDPTIIDIADQEEEQLEEAFPLSLAKRYTKDWNRKQNKEIFDQFPKNQTAKNPYRLYFPFSVKSGKVTKDTRIMNKVFDMLDELRNIEFVMDPVIYVSIDDQPRLEYYEKIAKSVAYKLGINKNTPEDIDEYIKGYIRIADGSYVKIGKTISNALSVLDRFDKGIMTGDIVPKNSSFKEIVGGIREILQQAQALFVSDPLRQGKNTLAEQLFVVISRHPYDIAGEGTNRDWQSCLSVTDGEEKKYIPIEIDGGFMVAYLVSKNDRNINKPIARIRIYKLVNIDDETQYIFVPDDSIYGLNVDAFARFVKKWCNKISTASPDGLYCSGQKVQYQKHAVKSGSKIKSEYGTAKRAVTIK